MRAILLPLAALALPVLATAQRLAAYDPFVATFTELQPPTALLPAPVGPVGAYPPAPALPPVGGTVPLPGDSTWNGLLGHHWYCNGAALAAMPTPTFPPLGPLPVPPAFPIAPAVLGQLGGGAPVTGIALDTAANVLYLCNAAGLTVGVAPVPGTPVVVPPFLKAFASAPIAGLDHDQLSNSLYYVDVPGVVYRTNLAGVLLGPPLPPPIPLPGPAGDVAVDKSGQVQALGLRPIYVVGGGLAVDVTNPQPMPFGAGPPTNVGLAYLGHPAANPPAGGCPCPNFAPGPTQFTTSVMTAGNAAWQIGLGALPPGQLVLVAFDFVFNPAFPLRNGIGCGFGFVLGSPTLVTGLGFANAAGTALYPLPLLLPPGVGPIYNQNFTFCPADPAGFVVTPMQAIWASGL